MIWTEEHRAQLRRMWDGGFSASLIAQSIGVTRSAVCGQAFRLGLQQRVSTYTAPRGSTEPRRRAPYAKQVIRFWKKSEPREKPTPIPYLDDKSIDGIPFLQNNGCKWILGDRRGDDGLALCCGRERTGESSYCASHQQRAWRPSLRREAE